MRQKRRSTRDDEDDEDSLGENLAEVTERLDDLTRQLARVARVNGARRTARVEPYDEDEEDEAREARPSRERQPREERPERREQREEPDDRTTDRVAEAIERLDRRLDQVIAEGRAAAAEAARRPAYLPQTVYSPPMAPAHPPVHAMAPPSPPPPPIPMPMPAAPPPVAAGPNGPNTWAMEISARQRALDGEPPAAPQAEPAPFAPPSPAPAAPAPAPAPHVAGPDLSGLENHLRDLTSQIAALHRPYEDGLTALRGDLAEIGRALTEALPRRAIETLEHEIRALSERVDHIRQSRGGVDASTLAGLEHGLAEVRDALRGLTPAESLVGVDEAVRGLSRKIDQIATSQQDPAAFHQIEHAIGSLRGLVSNVASDGALAQLAAEVHALAGKFERVAMSGGADALAALDQRISSLMESGRSLPPQLEASIRTLTEQLERSQLSQGDQLALRSLEDRIVKLFEKLDASDARLGSLAAIERGIADLLVAVGELRNAARAPRPAAPEPERVEDKHLPQAAQLNMPAQQILPPEPQAAPAPAAAPPAPVAVAPPPPPAPPQPRQTPPRAEPRRPIDPHLPPDTPLEPGTGAPRLKPGSPAARIAASEAALGNTRPPAPETGGKSAAIAAARNAARAAAEAEPPAPPAAAKAKAKPKAKPVAAPVDDREPLLLDTPDPAGAPAPGLSLRAKLMKHGKTLLIAASVVVIVLGLIQTAMDFLMPANPPVASSQAPAALEEPAQPAQRAPDAVPSAPATPARPMPTPGGEVLPPPAEPDPEPTGRIGNRNSFFDPSTVLSLPKAPDVTGSIGRNGAPRQGQAHAPAAGAAPQQTAALGTLPASVGPVLRAALAAGQPAAEYELGLRYAEGRGVPQNHEEAARWLGRAAAAGFAPAQFRLASLNEKGEGVKKDVPAARKLYLAAADKGHAKAMHNLAVLYAEGGDGKPDYRLAAQWFRKAAGYGVADSQYNLAILYARGIGMAQNLAESYKWFALAAAGGDGDAAKKRDDVGARLDKATLSAARLAAQSFTPEREPEEATNLHVPPGGWDRPATAQPARARPAAAPAAR